MYLGPGTVVRAGLNAAYFYGSDVNDIVIEARAREEFLQSFLNIKKNSPSIRSIG
jgi:hypothetical protein